MGEQRPFKTINPGLKKPGLKSLAALRRMRCSAYASGLVLGKPITRSPGLKSPRFLRSSTRSNLFSTFLFVWMVLAPFKLRCCDMTFSALGPRQ